jgi:putative DNA primase/helicase
LGRTLNIVSENEVGKEGLNTQYFKSIVSGDPIRVEIKGGKSFLYKPFCKILLAVNNLPYSRDKSSGFRRRLIMIPFNRMFQGQNDDKHLTEKLLKELPGILNFALQGLDRLRKNKYVFTDSKAVNELVDEYAKQLNPVYAFVIDNVVAATSLDRISYETLNRVFRNWCEENGHKTIRDMTMVTFMAEIKRSLRLQGIGHNTKKSNSSYYLHGVQLQLITAKSDDVSDLD